MVGESIWPPHPSWSGTKRTMTAPVSALISTAVQHGVSPASLVIGTLSQNHKPRSGDL
jgi:hypothetical protein